LFSEALDGILLTDEQGILHYCSLAVKTILGFDPEEIVNHNIFEFVHPDDTELAYLSFLNEVNNKPVVKFILVRLLKKDGTYLWCNVSGHNFLHNPHIRRVAIYFYDDSLRKQAEDALKQSEERFRNLVENIQLGVILRDADGKAILCNNAVLNLFDVDKNDLLNKPLADLKLMLINENNELISMEQHPSMIALHTKKPVEDFVMGLYRRRKKDWVWLLVNCNSILNEKGNIVYIIISFTDITVQKKLSQQLVEQEILRQRALTQTTIDTQEQEWMHIGKQLHDNIGQQLTTTKLYLDIAKQTANEANMEMISLATKSVYDVINEIRKLSRSITPSTLEDIGLVESIRDICESIKLTHAYTIRFYSQFFEEENLPANLKLTLFRIVQEQINNIIRHAQATTILIQLQNDAEELMLSVSDNGHGFNPSVKSNGSGLSNIKSRAQLFNGHTEIRSSAGKGCSLELLLFRW